MCSCFTDTFKGTKKDRPELNKCLEPLGECDSLVITRLGNLGRSAKDPLEILTALDERGVESGVLELNIDTKTPEAKIFHHRQWRRRVRERDHASYENGWLGSCKS